jgi:aldose 1-epimerase
MGYPGRLTARCTYRFDTEDRLWIEMEAETSAPTVVNLVNHAYFNLAGGGDVLGHHLRLAADHYTPVDDRLIPTGEVRAVEGTPFDFRRLRAIGAAMPDPAGFDHNFCLSGPLLPVAGALLRDCAEAVDPASGRRLRLWTDAPGVQVYTAGRMDAGRGKGGATLGHFAGFTLETQGFPDAPNRPQFPSTRLDPGQVWRHRMLFSFEPAE